MKLISKSVVHFCYHVQTSLVYCFCVSEYLILDMQKVSIHFAFVLVLSLLQMTAFLQDLLKTGNEQHFGKGIGYFFPTTNLDKCLFSRKRFFFFL